MQKEKLWCSEEEEEEEKAEREEMIRKEQRSKNERDNKGISTEKKEEGKGRGIKRGKTERRDRMEE